MAYSVTNLGAVGDTTGGSTLAISVAGVSQNGDPVSLWVNATRGAVSVPTVSSISGLGLTWSRVLASDEFGATNFMKGELWQGVGVASATSGTVTVTFSSSNTNGAQASVDQHHEVSTTSPFIAANTVKGGSSTGALNTGGASSPALPSTPSGPVWGCIAHLENEDFTVGTSFTHNSNAGNLTPASSVGTEYKTANTALVDASWASSKIWLVVGAELRLVSRLTKTHGTDALIASEHTKTHSTNAEILRTDKQTHSADAVAKKTQTKTQQVDSYLQASGSIKTHTTDALKLKTSSKTQSADADLLAAASPPPSDTTYGDGYGGGYGAAEAVAVVQPAPSPTPDLLVEIDLVHDVNGPVFEPTWTDVSDLLLKEGGLSNLSRGRHKLLDRNEAGTATLVFRNDDGEFDPDNDTSPFWPAFGPMRLVRVSAVTQSATTPFVTGSSELGGDDLQGGGPGSVVTTMIVGTIQNISYEYPERGFQGVCTVTIADAQARLALGRTFSAPRDVYAWLEYDSNGNVVAIHVESGALDQSLPTDPATTRILKLLAASGLHDPVAIKAGLGYTMNTTQYIAAPILDALQDVADSDGGNLFVSREGTWVYKTRDVATTPLDERLVFAVDVEPFADVGFTLDETLIFNKVHIQRADLGIQTDLSDAASISRYDERPLPSNLQTTLLEFQGDLDERASALLSQHRFAKRQIDHLDLSNVTVDWPLVLGLDLWDKVLVRARLVDGRVFEQVSLVQGIDISTPNFQIWNCVLWLSAPDFPELLSPDASDFEAPDGYWTFTFDPVTQTETWNNGGHDTRPITGWSAETNCRIQRTSNTCYNPNDPNQPSTVCFGRNFPDLPPWSYTVRGDESMTMVPLVSGDMSIISDPLPVVPNGFFEASAHVGLLVASGPSGVETGTQPVHVEIEWLDGLGAVLSTTVGDEIAQHLGLGFGGGWKFPRASAVAPGGAVQARVRIVSKGAIAAPHFVDVCSFRRS